MGTTNTFSLLLQVEALPMNLASDAVRTALLQKLMTPVSLRLINEPMMVVIVCFLLGQYHVKWSPLWKTVTSLLQALASTQAKLVWSCLRRALYCAAGYCDLDEKWYTEGMEEGCVKVKEEKCLKVKEEKCVEVKDKEETEKEEMKTETEERKETETDTDVKNRYEERLNHCTRYGTVTCRRSEEIENETDIGYEYVPW